MFCLLGSLWVSARASPSSSRAMVLRWISLVPVSTRYMRSRRNRNSTRLPWTMPSPPCTCTARSAMRKAVSEQNSLAMEASARASPPASRMRATLSISARAAASSVAMSASMCCTAWKAPMGWPNWRRRVAWAMRILQREAREAEHGRAVQQAVDGDAAERQRQALAPFADEVGGRDAAVGEHDVAGAGLAGHGLVAGLDARSRGGRARRRRRWSRAARGRRWWRR